MQSAQQQWFPVCAHMICLLLSQFYSFVSGQNSTYRVLVSNNGPTTIGGNTTFDATVLLGLSPVGLAALNRSETVAYTFWWKVKYSPAWIQHEKSLRTWDSFKWHWSESGRKTVDVYVAILEVTRQGHERHLSARNKTELMVTDNIVASLVATQDSEGKNETVTRKDFEVGQVKLQISIHDPSKLFRLNNISYDWNFGDGTRLNSSLLNKLSHNFTEDIGSYNVTVELRGWALGREYSGSTSKILTFKANFDPYLVIQSSQGPKLPPLNPNITLIATGPVTFEVKFKDPHHLISEVSTDWKFGGGTPSEVLNWKNGTMSHTYYKENMVVLWTTVRVKTKHHKLRPVILQKHLYFKEPVNYLNVTYTHSHPEKRVVAFDISCNGSVPVSFCWLVRKNCGLHSPSVCSHTVIQYKSCSLLVNHTFPNAGNYCITVSVVNQVSGINTSLTLKIPEGPTPTSSPHNKTELSMQTTIVAVVLCCLLVALIALIIKKWIRSNQKRTEKADFDFRDPETASVSDMTVSLHRESCFPWCKPENIPLLSKVQNGNYSPNSL